MAASRRSVYVFLCTLFLFALSSPAWSVSCAAVFTNGWQTNTSGGQIGAGYQALVTGGSNIIDSPNLSVQNPPGQPSCGGGTCTISGNPAAPAPVTFITGTASNGAISVGYQGSASRAEGDYGNVTLENQSQFTFTTNNGTYYTKTFVARDRATLNLAPGSYWIDGNLSLANDVVVRRQGGSGTVRLFVKGNVTINFAASFANFSAGDLLIYATGNVSLQTRLNIPAFVYAVGSVQTNNYQGQLTGAMSGAQLTIGQEHRVNFAGGVLNSVDFAPFCGQTNPPAVLQANWRFDEFSWQGNAGEVLDSSANNRHGTASGDASTLQDNPAIAGDPGTCRYGTLDGNGDYVTVAGLSNTLNDSASLAFWIKTTQTGDDVGWRAPGITGVEVAGGSDDIFWGWLDSSGRIGLSVGNTYNTKSNLSINNGTWRHVALTRNAASGDYKIYIDGALDSSGAGPTGIIGTAYNRLGRIEDTGGTPVDFAGQLDEVYLYSGVLTDTEVSELRNRTHPCPGEVCPTDDGEPRGGLLGDYYNTRDFSGALAGRRVDAPIDFNWTDGPPGVNGVTQDQFSVRWNGSIRATETGAYRFQTASDDGVRLWVDNQLVINRWNDHAVTTDTSNAVNLEAGGVYPVRMEFYENGGLAEIRLRWRTPSSSNYVPIPAGADAPSLTSGLYYCGTDQVAYYEIAHAGRGLTCEAEPITITAFDSTGTPVAPQAGTNLSLGTSPATGVWPEGEVYIFNGTESQIIRYLRQDQPATLNINVYDGLASESAAADPDIEFSDVGLKFYQSQGLEPVANQVAGTADPNPVLRVVQTDDDSGACVTRVQNRSLDVALGFECVNPSNCVAGQALTLAGVSVGANAQGASGNLTAVNLGFAADGFAAIPLMYTDVGEVRLHGTLTLPEDGNNPAVTVTGASNSFVVKPYTLAVSDVSRADATANPKTQSTGEGFVAAGEAFSVTVEARNSLGNVTPNFGNESTPQKPVLDEADLTLQYPSGGSKGTLSGTGAFTKVSGNSGQFNNISLRWSEVGSFTIEPRLNGNKYLSAGDIVAPTSSETVGRFYPYEYVLNSATSTNACEAGGLSFSYMSDPTIGLDYQLQANNLGGIIVTNYDQPLGYSGTASVEYVYENNGECLSSSGSCSYNRLIAGVEPWKAGQVEVSLTNVSFLRDSAPEAPLMNLQLALNVNDSLDGRSLTGKNVNPEASGNCAADDSCSAVALGEPLNLLYGRLFLGSAYGPEILDLPVKFVTEYYTGASWQRNDDDSCTRIALSDVTYPSGSIEVDANRNVTLGAGATRGEYADGGIEAGELTFAEGQREHYFSAPGGGNTGTFEVNIAMTPYPWLDFDWNNDGSDDGAITGEYQFGSYRGHDRIIYWREVLE
jgi:MSHA biogenesis protein MshQ